MSDLGLNKIFAAVLTTGLGLLGLNAASHSFFEHEAPEQPGYLVEISTTESSGSEAPAWVPPTDYGVLLAAADIEKGEKKVAACKACHTFEQGGADGTGPHLYGVVMRDKGSVAGFGYSAAIPGLGGVWDYESLDHFLTNPKKYASGTSMNFAGLSKEADRMNVIAYLRSLSTSPAPLPAPLPPEAFIEPTADESDAEVTEAASEVVDAAEATLSEAVDDATAPVSDAVEDITEAASDVAEEATGAASDVLDNAGDAVSDAVEGVQNAAEEVTEEASETVDEATEQ